MSPAFKYLSNNLKWKKYSKREMLNIYLYIEQLSPRINCNIIIIIIMIIIVVVVFVTTAIYLGFIMLKPSRYSQAIL